MGWLRDRADRVGHRARGLRQCRHGERSLPSESPLNMADDIPATKELSHEPVEGFAHHADIAADRESAGTPSRTGS
jgi:hypothetical protein